MNVRLLVLLPLAAHASAALAQYKCIAANGAVTFQQVPCVGAKTAQKLDIVPNGHPAGEAASASGNVDKRMLANYEKQDRRAALVRALRKAQDDSASRQRQHDADSDAVRQQLAQEPAGSPLLARALADVDSRYKAFALIDQERVRSAQAALDDWDKASR